MVLFASGSVWPWLEKEGVVPYSSGIGGKAGDPDVLWSLRVRGPVCFTVYEERFFWDGGEIKGFR